MLLSLSDLPNNTRLKADLCIVGAGPVGITLAREFEAGRTQVIVLESGGIALEDAFQSLNEGTIVGLPHSSVTDGRGRAIGGTGRLWAGQCLTMDPIDFAYRSWVPHSGWPFDANHMDPFYRRAEAFFRIDGQYYNESIYRMFGLSPPAWAPDTLHSHFTVYTPQVDTGRHHLRALRRSSAIRIITDATVVGIDLDPQSNAATAIRARSLSGTNCTVNARVFIICAGALENARILLNSDHQRPGGLGNSHDLVGRFFQDHANALVARLDGGDLLTLQNSFRLLYRRPFRYFPKFALSEQRQRVEQVLNANAHLVFEYDDNPGMGVMRDLLHACRHWQIPRQLAPRVGQLARDWRSLTRAVRRRYLQGLSPDGRPSAIRLQCYLEQAPDWHCRLRLSDQTDVLGQRQLELDWRLTDHEQRTLRVMLATVQAEFQRLGLGRIIPEPWIDDGQWQTHLSDGAHNAGTTRMASAPQHGVVSPDCEVFDTPQLYVCGGSVFPTSGYANPTLTAVALAIRLADHLRSKYQLN